VNKWAHSDRVSLQLWAIKIASVCKGRLSRWAERHELEASQAGPVSLFGRPLPPFAALAAGHWRLGGLPLEQRACSGRLQ